MVLSRFKITERSLKAMDAAGVPSAILQKLGTIKDQKPKRRGQFVRLLQKTIGYKEAAEYQSAVLKAAATKPRKGQFHPPSFVQWLWKVIQSTLLSAVIVFAIFVLDRLDKKLFPGLENPTVHLIQVAKQWAHYAMFVVFLTIKILHNIGMIGD
jgi:hypothetical protein